MDRALQPLWDGLVHAVGSARLGHPFFFILPVIATVLVAGLAFSFVDAFLTRKLAPRRSLAYMLITLPGYVLVYVALELLPAPYRVAVPAQAPSVARLVGELALCLVIGDLLSYWWHRLEHASPFIFTRVHRVHHSVTTPLTVWSGFYVHPVESFCVFVTMYAYPFVVGVHPLTFALVAVVTTFANMVTHCGYDLWWYPKWLLASAPMHDLHHRGRRPMNFSVVLNLSDKLFGTYAPPARRRV